MISSIDALPIALPEKEVPPPFVFVGKKAES